MASELGQELEREAFDWIPWRARVVLWNVLAALGGFALALYLRGRHPSSADVVYTMLSAAAFGFFGERGARRSPWGVRSRLRSLFRQSAQPDLVAITEVLSEAGESPRLEPHRQAVDRFMRGMISESEFYAAMRTLAA
jgi:hypothetical protein